MKRSWCLATLSAVMLAATCVVAQQKPAAKPAAPVSSLPEAADQAVRATATAFADAFNRGDAKAVAALWTLEGDFIDESGNVTSGQQALEKKYAEFFAAHPGAKMTITIDALRALGPDTIVEDGHATVTFAPDGSTTGSRYTAIHVRRDNKWLMASVRDLPATPSTLSETRADLEFLVGKWTAEHEGTHVDIDCHWIAGKAYLEANYHIHKGDHTVSTSTQIIGADPVTGRIMSWMFDSNGGRAEGIWSAGPGGWAIEFFGVTAEGTYTTATNYLTKVEDALVWKSLNRTAAGQPLPDINEVVLKKTK
ncbi:MAG: SgcJ/EcaC family oxidoreductase [Pirellulales bacterium]|nr:SgcJ/EcaC family oxidoreductase [Pirellulales bacterium]